MDVTFKYLETLISEGSYIYNEKATLTTWEDVYETFLTDCLKAISFRTGGSYEECLDLYKLAKEIIQNLSIRLNLNTIDSQMKLVTTLEIMCKLTDM